jgi:hypothetical protein
MPFIRVRLLYMQPSDINSDHISVITPIKGGTRLVLLGGTVIEVRETREEIKALIAETTESVPMFGGGPG